MNIIIVGLGRIGLFTAAMLSGEKHNVLAVDTDNKKLQEASSRMDLATRQGSGTDWQLLDDLLDFAPDLMIAATGSDDANLVMSIIAKRLGYPRVICRIRDIRYLNSTHLDFGSIFDVDAFVSPEYLAACDILKHVINPGSLAIENFVHGTIQLRTLVVPSKWKRSKIPLKDLELSEHVIVALIERKVQEEGFKGKRVIFPHGNDMILPGDEVTFIGESNTISEIHEVLGVEEKTIESLVIVGGSLTGINLVNLLADKKISIRLIEKDYQKCCKLADLFPSLTIINHDGTDLEFLKTEQIGQTDLFVACTGSDEVNILSALLAKNLGCKEVMTTTSNLSYTDLIEDLGITYSASASLNASRHIMTQIISGKVTSLISLYEGQAEILEVNVSSHSKIIGIPISDLGPLLPKEFLIAMIQNRGRSMVAHGDQIISPGDTIVVVTSPKHIHLLEKIF